MWLFDDILNKPTNSSSTGGQSGGWQSGSNPSDPLTNTTQPAQSPAFIIEKSEAHSIFDTTNTEEASIPSSETPVQPTESIIRTIETPIQSQEDISSLASVVSPTTPAPSIETSESVSSNNSLSQDSGFSFFEDIQKTTDSETDVSWNHVIENTSGETHFSHPKEFIEKSITEIDAMILSINDAHAAEIKKAEEYGKEEEHQALLKQEAYESAHLMEEEKKHAEHMREILENELTATKKIEANKMESEAPNEKEASESIWNTALPEEIIENNTPQNNEIPSQILNTPTTNDDIMIVSTPSETLAA